MQQAKSAKSTVLALVVLGFWGIHISHGGTVRDEVLRVVMLEPCGHALAAGWSPSRELGSAGVSEAVWEPVAVALAEEELTRWIRGDLAQKVARVRHLRELAQTSGDKDMREEAGKKAAELDVELRGEGRKLRRLAALLKEVGSHRENALCVTERMVKEIPDEAKAASSARIAWVHLALASENSGRFSELGNWLLENRGTDSPALIDYCHVLWKAWGGLAAERPETANAVARWLLSVSECVQDVASASDFDRCAAGEAYYDRPALQPGARRLPGLPGWVGSVQRKRLAARFENRDGSGGPLHERAAAELAADEAELTDLREVYGDWNGDGDNGD